MARQEINYAFTERLGRNEFVIIPVITPEGNIKHLKIRPDVQPEQWLLIEWAKDSAGRLRAVKSVELSSERQKAGAMFLRDAYEAERWPDGWRQYERYLEACYTRPGIDRDGKPTRVKMNRPNEHLHFPTRLLPKAVAERVAAREVKRSETEWSPDADVKHPVDEQAEIAEMRAELGVQVSAPTVAIVTKGPNGTSVSHGPEQPKPPQKAK